MNESTPSLPSVGRPAAVLFDLLTALLDSWTLWNSCAGSDEAGRAWRAQYLQLTYGCGDYVPYEELVRQAAASVGLGPAAPAALEARWDELRPWPGALAALREAGRHSKLAVVTNCSVRLGQSAAQRLGIRWDSIVTAEEAGVYKPNPQPYQLALLDLGISAGQAAFVAGSGYDLIGTARVGLRTYWHNRAGLSLPPGASAPDMEAHSLAGLPAWLDTFPSISTRPSDLSS